MSDLDIPQSKTDSELAVAESEGAISSAETVEYLSTEKGTMEGNRKLYTSGASKKSSRGANIYFLAKESRTTELTLHMTVQDWEASEYARPKTQDTGIDQATDVAVTEETAKKQVAGLHRGAQPLNSSTWQYQYTSPQKTTQVEY